MDNLVKYRLELSSERLKSAEILFQSGQFKDSISRSYYAIFTAVRAILATVPIDFAKHAGVIQYFHKEYIKTGKIDSYFGKIIETAFKVRNSCDYNDFYLVSADDAKTQLENAKAFLQMVISFLNTTEGRDHAKK